MNSYKNNSRGAKYARSATSFFAHKIRTINSKHLAYQISGQLPCKYYFIPPSNKTIFLCFSFFRLRFKSMIAVTPPFTGLRGGTVPLPLPLYTPWYKKFSFSLSKEKVIILLFLSRAMGNYLSSKWQLLLSSG